MTQFLASFRVTIVVGLVGCASSATANRAPEPQATPLIQADTPPSAPLQPSSREDCFAVPVDEHEAARGNPDAAITIVEFSDFQCPFCRRGEATVTLLMQMFPNTRLVWRHFPLSFHENAIPAALAAEEARAQGGDSAFWAMHDVLFAHQRALTRPDLERYAAELHLDLQRFTTALDQRTHIEKIRNDFTLGASIEIDGTPAFFINGKPIIGAQPLRNFIELIEAEQDRLAAIGHPVSYNEAIAGCRPPVLPASRVP